MVAVVLVAKQRGLWELLEHQILAAAAVAHVMVFHLQQ